MKSSSSYAEIKNAWNLLSTPSRIFVASYLGEKINYVSGNFWVVGEAPTDN
jgi:hypothetical protein